MEVRAQRHHGARSPRRIPSQANPPRNPRAFLAERVLPMSSVVRAALVQAKWTGDAASMLDQHEQYARRAAAGGARVIGFQEMFNAPYFCQVEEPEHYRWAEAVPDGPTVHRMSGLAAELGMVMV